ncbi:MAG TPA: D-tagatose-bisphosphate aldolase, class II, non-catalytic subunit [Devosia sp.]|nr:D-tagatose-bisphosphate aldolase, class II, non-catalytic subunit [Devosia sp.]
MSIDDNRRQVLAKLAGADAAARLRGIPSVCSAHPLVLEAALRRGLHHGVPVLIEATCNQVNQEGGYTGMTPADFRAFVEAIARRLGFPLNDLILGGDHLGPNPWKSLPAEDAMLRAEAMVAAYVAAGFRKIHLDCSMGCAGEPAALGDEVTADRAARLAGIAEQQAAQTGGSLVYIIGTEVPPPGGATHAITELEVTSPGAVRGTLDVHRRAFADAGVEAALERVIGIVVQPGVEFGNANVVLYRPDRARNLSAALAHMPGLVYEAHSTDYQPAAALRALVDDGFAILKVGPGLTFALREALYGLDAIAAELDGDSRSLQTAMEALMLAQPQHWSSHYPGGPGEQRLQRHFSYSDRIRYYWPEPRAQAAVEALMARFNGRVIPQTLISQYLARLYLKVVSDGLAAAPRDLCLAAIDAALDPYYAAIL